MFRMSGAMGLRLLRLPTSISTSESRSSHVKRRTVFLLLPNPNPNPNPNLVLQKGLHYHLVALSRPVPANPYHVVSTRRHLLSESLPAFLCSFVGLQLECVSPPDPSPIYSYRMMYVLSGLRSPWPVSRWLEYSEPHLKITLRWQHLGR